MQKTQLRPSPLQVIKQEFVSVSVDAKYGDEFGPGNIHVDREVNLEDPERNLWTICLNIKIDSTKDDCAPPYTGQLVAYGEYQVHDSYTQDPERLVRITGASMLYGAARELFAQITARGPNGLLTLPSVSFYEPPPQQKSVKAKTSKKKVAKKAAFKKSTPKKKSTK